MGNNWHDLRPVDTGYDLVFAARLRGVNVTCIVPASDDDCPDVSAVRVEVTASDATRGLAAVSKFAGYCPRTLALTEVSDDERAWAQVLASYFGFGLILVTNGERQDLMPPAALDETSGSSVRERFRSTVRSCVDHL